MMARGIFILALAWTFTVVAQAQLVASLRLNKTQHVAGEAVVAVITVTNHAGQDLTFHGDGRTEWLDFIVKNNRGDQVNQRGRKAFGSMRIGAGQSMSREVDLASHFLLTEPGNYSVSAMVRIPGSQIAGTATNRILFSLNPGKLYWSQKVGMPGQAGQTREFRVIQFSSDQKSQVFAQIIDNRTGMHIRTFLLGDALSLRKPSVTIDRSQCMHVLFLATPTMWVHYIIDTDGKVVNRDIHERGAQGDPKLMTFGDGTVRVSNSIPYDPAAAAAARAKIRKISERPGGVYE